MSNHISNTPITNQSKIQDMQQNNAEGEKLQTGRWSKEEHQRFMYAIMQYGKDWKKVQQYVRTRSGSQVRSHAQKFFGKLQKGNNHQQPLQRSHQQFSETEFDLQRQLNNEMTPSTPLELVSLIKKQSKEEGGRINLGTLKKKLEQSNDLVNKEREKNEMPESLQRQNSYKSMSNILSAYEEVQSEKEEKQAEDEGFLILLTKKYKKYFGKIADFDKLIDISSSPVINRENVARKRSFTLPEGSQLSGDQLQQKIQSIKKQINTETNQKGKLMAEKSEQKIEEKQVNKSNESKQEDLVPLNRLATIQQQAREDQEMNSFLIIPNVDAEMEQRLKTMK